jgi:hypothetical protein
MILPLEYAPNLMILPLEYGGQFKRKMEGGDWKRRYCEIILEGGEKKLKMYREQETAGDQNMPTQVCKTPKNLQD